MRNIETLKKTLAFLTAAVAMAAYSAGCSEATNTDKASTESAVTETMSVSEESGSSLSADTVANVKSSSSDLFSSRDLDPSYDEITETITLGSESVTITEEGVYLIKGTLKDGQIIVNAPKAKVQLVLDGADITCSDSSAIYVQDADKVFITLAEGSENTVSDGKTYANAEDENAPSAAIFSEDSLTINGSGSLTVNGNYMNGIQSKDDIVITGGTITVTAANDGIKGKDYVAVADGDFTVDAGGDGIKSTNAEDEGMGFVYIEGGKFDITAVNDGIQAETVLTVTDGTLDITSGGGYEKSDKTHTDNFGGGGMFGGHGGFGNNGDPGEMPEGGFGGRGGFGQNEMSETEVSFTQLADLTVTEDTTADDTASDSTKGLKAGTEIKISGGTFNIDAADDTIHSDGDVNITGGVFTINAGDDGIHSEAAVNIGEKAENDFETVQIFIANCYEGIEGVTINQNSGTVYIISGDDGFNAAGGALDTTTEQRGPMMSTSTGTLNINGGLAVVNSANGDHDAFDSNGDVNLNGGYICANGQEPIDCGDSGGSINYNGTSVITMTAGNTYLSQRYSFVDNDGNVIVSFMSANGNAGQNCTDCKAYSGGTVSGGTEVLAQADKYAVTFGGTLKDGTEITAEAETGGMFGGGMKGGRQFAENGEMPEGMEPPTGEDGRPQMPEGMELPTDENGEIQMPEGGFSGGHRGGGMRRQQTTEENSAN
ncbi:MAG: carbohydrate-binding domain-containing protein [Ruminococcus sp.]|nr:carbohydrate-binding domain-containing protein [Ruminococcus sp.]